ncbi:putative disease resistance protein RGA3 isoform X1 [Carex rostrata]
MVLSTVGEWFGSAIISKLVDTASSYMGEHMLPADTKSELRRVKAALPKITAVMGVGEVLKLKHPNSGVNAWLEQFKEAFFAAEDVLDELKYRDLEDMVKARDQVSGSSSSIIGNSMKRKFTGSTISEDTLKRLREAVQMLDLAIADIGHFFQFATALDVHGHANPNDNSFYNSSRETTSFLTKNKVFGRQTEKAMIIEWLKKPASHGNIFAFCIVGVGGLGKTTLAQLIFDEISKENHFDKTIWVCVSTSFSIEDITRKILEDLGEITHNNESLGGLQKRLIKKIISKKFFLILDDVWNDDKLCDWEKLIVPLEYAQQGSKILLTTRMKSVADMFARVLNVERENLLLEGLKEQELLELLNKYAFSGYNLDNHKDLQKIGNDIVKKLRGSPLAAKVIGSLLNSSMDFRYWKRILNHDSLINLEQAKDVADVLKLSYYYLPAHLQECFRFCCIFPQDYQFKKDELIKMWMASGFIRQELHGEERPEDIGEEYFNHLCRKSFFEQWFGHYVMHDLMHDLAQNVSKGECCRVEPNGQPDVIPCSEQHVSVHESKIERIFNLKNLRTLVITYEYCEKRDRFVPPNGLLKETLRLLVIQGKGCACELPEEIGSLMHLRFLKVAHYSLWQPFRYLLPNSINKLYHLQVLEMPVALFPNYEGVETTGITNLVSLRYIELPNTLKKTIHRVHKLTSLQELDFFVGQESGHHIDELHMLNNLRSLSIHNLENVGNPVEATNANLSKKESLISLSLNWTKGSNSDDLEQVIDNLQPNGNLKELTINYYTGYRSPNWMRGSSHQLLSSLELEGCTLWEELPFLGQMPYLKKLFLKEMDEVKEVDYSCDSTGDCTFPSLKWLYFRNMPNLAKIPAIPFSLFSFHVDNVGLNSLPNMHHGSSITAPAPSFMKSSLKEVDITKCPKLIALNGFMLQQNLDLEALEELTIEDCLNLVQLPTGAFGNFVSLKHLVIMGIPNMVIVDNQSISLLAKLESLEMGNCGELDVPLLESASQLSTLAILHIKNSANITCIPSSENAFASLSALIIHGCDKLIEISSMQQTHIVNLANNMVSLKISHLNIDQLCLLLIGPLRCLRFVSELRVDKCSGMEALPEQWLLQNSSTLKSLTIEDASSLRSLPCRMEMLTALRKIHIHKCRCNGDISDLPAFVKDKCINSCLLAKRNL